MGLSKWSNTLLTISEWLWGIHKDRLTWRPLRTHGTNCTYRTWKGRTRASSVASVTRRTNGAGSSWKSCSTCWSHWTNGAWSARLTQWSSNARRSSRSCSSLATLYQKHMAYQSSQSSCWLLTDRNLQTSKAPLKSQAQDTRLFMNAASNQRGCPKDSLWEAQVRLAKGERRQISR